MDFEFLIITNYHVVEEAAEETPLEDFKLDGKFCFRISLAEKSNIAGTTCELQARIVQCDKKHDLALLTLVFNSDDAEAVQDFTGHHISTYLQS